MAIYNWTNTVITWHFNPDNVRDPTIIYNVVTEAYGTASGYTGTSYAFSPINFAPNNNDTTFGSNTYTRILLEQFGITSTSAKEVIITGNAGASGAHEWTGWIYLWFRAPGSSWDKSPIANFVGTVSNFTVHAPVGLGADGKPAIEVAWGTKGFTRTNWGTGSSIVDNVWLVGILSAWGE
jgi:hypothetical protein